jgi:hypothetical protein
MVDVTGLSSQEIESIRDDRSEELYDIISQWVRYGEYLTIIIDTDAETAKVKINNKC